MTAPSQAAPRRCCFTSPLDSATGAQLCMHPTENVAQERADSPVTQAAAYPMPACGYADPLAAYDQEGLQEQLTSTAVDVTSRFCLEVRMLAGSGGNPAAGATAYEVQPRAPIHHLQTEGRPNAPLHSIRAAGRGYRGGAGQHERLVQRPHQWGGRHLLLCR